MGNYILDTGIVLGLLLPELGSGAGYIFPINSLPASIRGGQ